MQAANRVFRLVFLGLVLCCGAAHADEEPAIPQATLDQARQCYQRGAAAFESEHYQQALGEFQQAYQLSRLPALLYNLALVEEKLGHDRDAIAHLEQYLRTPDIQDRADVEAMLGRLRDRAPPAAPPPVPPPAREGPRPLWVSGWALGGAGVLGVVVGSALIGLDGTQDCGAAPRQCKEVLDTKTGGIVLLTAGLASIGTAAVLLVLDHRRKGAR